MDYFKTRELYHHGIKGQKWGVRRYQYEDGTLTAEGRKRYGRVGEIDRFYVDPATRTKLKYNRKIDRLEADRKMDNAAIDSRPGNNWMWDPDNNETVRDYSNRYYDERINKLATKRDAKIERINQKIEAVKKYDKLYDKATSLADRGYDKWIAASKEYQKTGKTYLSRIWNNVMYTNDQKVAAKRARLENASDKKRQNFENIVKSVRKYDKLADESGRLEDRAYDTWQKAEQAYKELGKTYLSRVWTAAKYSPRK